MKTKILLSVIALAVSCPLATFAANQLQLEHTLDGYYWPYNMLLYQAPADEKGYFYCPSITLVGNEFEYRTYNEDYTVRDNYLVTFDIPDGYEVSTLHFSPGMTFPDGSGFFMVSFKKQEYTEMGTPNYAIANAYDIQTGKKIFSLGSASFFVTPNNLFYEINGKISMIVWEADNKDGEISYKTSVYSLGEADNAVHSLPADNSRPVPIITVDASGRIVDQPLPGSMSITRMSDGSTIKTLNK